MTSLFVISRALIAGGGAPEIEVALRLMEYSQTLTGMEAYCGRAFAEAMEVIPFTLAENAGLNPISVVTELRNRHAHGEKNAGINVRKVSRGRDLMLLLVSGRTIVLLPDPVHGDLMLLLVSGRTIVLLPDPVHGGT